MFTDRPPIEATAHETPGEAARCIILFVCGDVMTGRGVDQILPHPGDSTLHEPSIKSANSYVALAERANGPISRPVDFSYVWGDALTELEHIAPDVRIINLETTVTSSSDYWEDKGIHYRMSPANVPVLMAAGIDCCVLANNHVLDWGYAGLAETLETLEAAGINNAGAGRDKLRAQQPAVFELAGGRRVLVFAFGSPSSGVPPRWAAAQDRPGVNLIDEASSDAAARAGDIIACAKRPGDLVVASIHWGGNWGYGVPCTQRRFARELIDCAGVDVVHGHSSHHVKGLEVYKRKPIMYGCGDFLSDYEGIEGYEPFRDDLGLMYFVSLNSANRSLAELQMRPTRIRRFQVTRASTADAEWLAGTLNREGRELGTRVERDASGMLNLRWRDNDATARPGVT